MQLLVPLPILKLIVQVVTNLTWRLVSKTTKDFTDDRLRLQPAKLLEALRTQQPLPKLHFIAKFTQLDNQSFYQTASFIQSLELLESLLQHPELDLTAPDFLANALVVHYANREAVTIFARSKLSFDPTELETLELPLGAELPLLLRPETPQQIRSEHLECYIGEYHTEEALELLQAYPECASLALLMDVARPQVKVAQTIIRIPQVQEEIRVNGIYNFVKQCVEKYNAELLRMVLRETLRLGLPIVVNPPIAVQNYIRLKRNGYLGEQLHALMEQDPRNLYQYVTLVN